MNNVEEAQKRIEKARKTKAKKLDLSGMGLSEIQFGDLPYLKELDLSDNSIGENGAEYIAELKNLTSLNLQDNSIGVKGAEHISELKNLTSLNLRSNSIGAKGVAHLSELKNLTYLILSENSCGEEGANHLSELKNLTFLNLTFNSIGDKGAEYLSNLENLTSINLTYNSIGDKGAEHLSRLKNLTSLGLANNSIGSKGAEHLSKLKNLTSLILWNNSIDDKAAEHLSELKNLTVLDLWSNSIRDTGAEHLSGLKNLTFLDLSDNSIGDKGAEHLSELKNLTELNIRNNSIEQLPKDILLNAKAFLEYWGVREKTKNTVVKMVLMGNGCAGKTSLANYLSERKIITEWDRTHGIDHWKWNISRSKRKYKVNIFDFGGQDYYHATHNLFINKDREGSSDTLYLTMWTNKLSEEGGEKELQHSLPYWLGNVRYYSKLSPIWCVQNKVDLDGKLWIETEWMKDNEVSEQFQICLGAFNNKLKLKKRAYHKTEFTRFEDHLKDFLIKKAAELELPKSWVEIRDNRLVDWRNKGDVMVTVSEFEKKCLSIMPGNARAKKRELAFDGLLVYLQGIGEILLFEDVPSLKDQVFLDPIGLTKTIYDQLLTKDLLEQHDGVLTQEMISHDQNGDDRQVEEINKLKIYLRLLESAELIFEDPNRPGTYVAPQFLPYDAHAYRFTSLIPVSYVLDFKGYFPRSLITQFIVRYAAKSEDPLYWRYGAFFKSEKGVHAMVRIEAEESTRIHVHVGDEKGRFELMQELFEFFTELPTRATLRKKGSDKGRSSDPEKSEGSEMKDSRLKPGSNRMKNLMKMVHLSTNNIDFAPLKDWKEAIDAKSQYVITKEGRLLSPDATIHQLLNPDMSGIPKRIFLSYSHKDEAYKEELDTHFSALKRSGKIETWNDRELKGGEEWDSKILDTLRNSDIFIAIISPDFMASDYIWNKEVPLAEEAGCDVVPVFLRACDLSDTVFADVKGFPKDQQDPNGLGKLEHTRWIVGNRTRTKDMCYLEVVEGVKQLLK